jgi:hypothetical protein
MEPHSWNDVTKRETKRQLLEHISGKYTGASKQGPKSSSRIRPDDVPLTGHNE